MALRKYILSSHQKNYCEYPHGTPTPATVAVQTDATSPTLKFYCDEHTPQTKEEREREARLKMLSVVPREE